MISYQIEKDNCITIWLSKESKPGQRLRLKLDNHIINISRPNSLRNTYVVLGPCMSLSFRAVSSFIIVRFRSKTPIGFSLEIHSISLASNLGLMF